MGQPVNEQHIYALDEGKPSNISSLISHLYLEEVTSPTNDHISPRENRYQGVYP